MIQLKKSSNNEAKKRYLLEIYGIVQGVGFRPFVYNTAKKFEICGWVNNSGGSVVIDLTGTEENIKCFVLEVTKNPPMRAVIEKIRCCSLKYCEYDDFNIKKSLKVISTMKFISPDIATCKKCAGDVLNKNGKRYRYAFTNCSECGPRYSIIKSLPYDRVSTTMDEFEMCGSCKREYNDCSNRRFHAEPNCCGKCGPSLTLMDNKGNIINCSDIITKTVELIKSGKIVAVKGIGGFHLICDGRNEIAVGELRKRKKRRDKPLAVMIKNLKLVKKFCKVSEKEEQIMEGSRRPILLLRKNQKFMLPSNIAPTQKRLGVMLPYMPLHYLLLERQLDVLIMTSGNVSGMPIEYKNDSAFEKLSSVADYFLMHDREIYVPIDDSVVKIFNDKECILRIGRGYAPYTENLKLEDNIIALGAEEKNNISFSKNGYVYASQYLGDLKNLDSFKNYKYVLKHLVDLIGINPEVLVYDMHPLYTTSKYAEGFGGIKIKVQHHHAHMVSCMAEYNISEKVIGVIYDGTGFGEDGNIWGGEFFVGTRSAFKRVGHLEYVKIQGGDMSVIEPWRCAASYLYSLNYPISKFINNVDKSRINLIVQALKYSINCYTSSSMGRLFDAISSLIGLRNYITYDGQAAVDLENIADESIKEKYDYIIDNINDNFEIEYKDIICGVIEDIERNVPKSVISSKFHNTISKATCELVLIISKLYDIDKVVLSGGVFQNEYLLKSVFRELTQSGLKVFFNSKIPINDGGISFGQIASASAILKKE